MRVAGAASPSHRATPLVTAHGASAGAIIKTVIAIVIVALLVPAFRYVARWTSPWVRYDKDPRFGVSFPIEPTKKTSGKQVALLASHPTLPKTFEFSYVQIPYAVDAQGAGRSSIVQFRHTCASTTGH